MMRVVLPVLAACGLVLSLATARADCDRGRWLAKVGDSGRVIALDNGSRWQVADTDQYIAERWKQDAPITACNDQLINREDHEMVRAEETQRGF